MRKCLRTRCIALPLLWSLFPAPLRPRSSLPRWAELSVLSPWCRKTPGRPDPRPCLFAHSDGASSWQTLRKRKRSESWPEGTCFPSFLNCGPSSPRPLSCSQIPWSSGWWVLASFYGASQQGDWFDATHSSQSKADRDPADSSD